MGRKQVIMFQKDSTVLSRKKDEYHDARIGNFRFEPMFDRIVRRCGLMETYHQEDNGVKDNDVLNCWSDRHNRVKNIMLGRNHSEAIQAKVQDRYAYRMPFRAFVATYNSMMKLFDVYCKHEENPPYNERKEFVQWKRLDLPFGDGPISDCELGLLEKALEKNYSK